MTKNILCFGDSNTWGINPNTGKRFDESIRWTSQLAAKLGLGFNIIEAGQPNRTLVNHPAYNGSLSGVSYLKPYLAKYPLEVIIIALGTNDLKKRFNLSPEQIGQGLNSLIGNIRNFYGVAELPKVVVLSPVYTKLLGSYKYIYEGAEGKNKLLSVHFERVAKNNKVHFFDLQRVASASAKDGVHICSEGHAKVAGAVFKLLSEDIVLV